MWIFLQIAFSISNHFIDDRDGGGDGEDDEDGVPDGGNGCKHGAALCLLFG